MQKWKPAVHQWGMVPQLLARILAQLEANANPGEKVAPISPATAQDILDEETADFDEWLIEEWMEVVPDEEYVAMANAHLDDVRDATASGDGTVRVIALPETGNRTE